VNLYTCLTLSQSPHYRRLSREFALTRPDHAQLLATSREPLRSRGCARSIRTDVATHTRASVVTDGVRLREGASNTTNAFTALRHPLTGHGFQPRCSRSTAPAVAVSTTTSLPLTSSPRCRPRLRPYPCPRLRPRPLPPPSLVRTGAQFDDAPRLRARSSPKNIPTLKEYSFDTFSR